MQNFSSNQILVSEVYGSEVLFLVKKWQEKSFKKSRPLTGVNKKALPVFRKGFNAEEEGFEPPVPHGTTVFKTAAIDHSATPLSVSIGNRVCKNSGLKELCQLLSQFLL